MPGRRWVGQLVCLAAMLIVTAGLSAGRQFDAAGAIVSISLSDTAGMSAPETFQGISSSQWRLETLGRQFTEPVDTLSALRNPADTHSPALLPAVPAAISMTLCGFLCVSFVRDRRAWLAMACGLLWLGQAGIQAVPQLGHKLCHRMAAANHSTPKLNPALAANSFERTGNHDTIRYIGLLRRLEAIPNHNLCSIQDSVRKHSIPPQAFTAQTNWPETLIECPAGAAGNFIIGFSPAFIFTNLPRGPPEIKMRVFPTKVQRAASRNVL